MGRIPALSVWLTALLTLFLLPLSAQESTQDTGVGGFFKKMEFKPIIDLQLWATYTSGTQVADTIPGSFIEADDRLNFVVRRARFGFNLKPHERLTVTTIAQIDFIGRDILAGYPGGANNTTFPEVGLWDMRITYRVLPHSEALYLTTGYFAPHFSREHTTPWHFVSSNAKAQSQMYIRRHMTNRGPGRDVGVSAGGLLRLNENLHVKYDLGVFNPVFTQGILNTSGLESSALIASRINVQFGDPETPVYQYMSPAVDGNLVRKGLSIGLSGHWQGENDLFKSSSGAAIDALFNHGPFHIEGEMAFLFRAGDRLTEKGTVRDFTYDYNVGFVRTGYNFVLANKQAIEPSVLFTWFEGTKAFDEQLDASSVLSPSGSTWGLDVGLNWYIVRNKVKASLHYTFQGTDAGEAGAENITNELIVFSGALIQRGDWLGLGLVLRL